MNTEETEVFVSVSSFNRVKINPEKKFKNSFCSNKNILLIIIELTNLPKSINYWHIESGSNILWLY